MKIIKKYSQIFALVGCLLMIISCFIPFSSSSVIGINVSYTLMEELGIYIIISAIVSAILIILKKSLFVFLSFLASIALIFFSVWNNIDGINIGTYTMALSLFLIIQFCFFNIGKLEVKKSETVKLVEGKKEKNNNETFVNPSKSNVPQNYFCRNCGNKLDKPMRFCNKCGARIQI